MTHSPLRAAITAFAFLIGTGTIVALYLVATPFGARARRIFACLFFNLCLALTGITIRCLGTRQEAAGVLYVANHVSYLDIPVLAASGDGAFVAKSEVRDWPLFGFLARVGRTVFVSRQAANVRGEQVAIRRRLDDGESVFLFPEGSSSNGAGVLPFRAGLMSAARTDGSASVSVQPISIVYGPQVPERPGLTRAERDCYAWYGAMELLPHLWRLFGTAERVVVAVQFHPPRAACDFESTRALAQWAERTVARGTRQIMLSEVRAREEQAGTLPLLERDFSF